MLGLNEKARDTIEVARKEKDGNLPRPLPFRVGADPLLLVRTPLLLEEMGSSCWEVCFLDSSFPFRI